MANYLLVQNVFSYDLKLSHNISVTDRQTDGRKTTMPIARQLLKYCRLKILRKPMWLR